jgi:PTS system glucitol/sorbitol-specific IIA component
VTGEGPAGVRLDTTVTHVGEMASAFLDLGIIVFFGDEAPQELQDVAVVHTPSVNVGGISPGDVVETTYEDTVTTFGILAVGDVANDNMRNLGHLVLKRNGETVAKLPGDVCCDEGPAPELGPGAHIMITAGDPA